MLAAGHRPAGGQSGDQVVGHAGFSLGRVPRTIRDRPPEYVPLPDPVQVLWLDRSQSDKLTRDAHSSAHLSTKAAKAASNSIGGLGGLHPSCWGPLPYMERVST